MNSPYSSYFRSMVWGGVPISLLSLAVYSYLLALFVAFAWTGRLEKRADTSFLLATAALPLSMTVIYGAISVFMVKSVCKLCMGVYLSSAGYAAVAALLHQKSRVKLDASSNMRRVVYVGLGVFSVLLSLGVYLAALPDYEQKVQSCAVLKKPEDKQRALLEVTSPANAQHTWLEVIDPLCPACKAFEGQLRHEVGAGQAARKMLLFPLDSECNWMLRQSLHPGACWLSRALLCADRQFDDMFAYIMQEQEDLRIAGGKSVDELKKRVLTFYPQIQGCVDKAETKARLNHMLRYAVANALPLQTPQLFVDNRRVCDEDTDLGLRYTLSVLSKSR